MTEANQAPEHGTCETPWEDLRQNAIWHYDKVSSLAHEWSSVVPRAINYYFDHARVASPVATGECEWVLDCATDSTIWETSCGDAFVFEDGGPSENRQKFCPYCGKRSTERKINEDYDDAE